MTPIGQADRGGPPTPAAPPSTLQTPLLLCCKKQTQSRDNLQIS